MQTGIPVFQLWLATKSVPVTMPSCGEIQGPTDYPFTVNTDNGPVVIPDNVFRVFVPTLPATGRPVGGYLQVGGVLLGTGLALVGIGSLRRRKST